MEQPDYVGYTEAEAREKAQEDGFARVRVTSIDGKGLMGTCDFRMDRVNIDLVADRVTRSRIG